MPKEKISFKVDGQTVFGTLFTPEVESKGVGVLFLHGWTGKPNNWCAEFLAEHGYTTLTFSMRGHSPSDGNIKSVTSKNSLDDAVAAYNVLVKSLPKNAPIFVVGNSYGASISAHLTGANAVAGISLRVPAAYQDELFKLSKWGRGSQNEQDSLWRQQPLHYSQNRGFQRIHDFKGPIQILEAEKDEIIPHQTVKNYVDAVSDPKQLEYVVLKGWPHSMGTDKSRIKENNELILRWIDKNTSKS